MWLRVEAVNDAFSGAVEICPSDDDLQSVGFGLKAFPSRVPLEYQGSLEGTSQNLQIDARTTDRAGHCSLRITLSGSGGQWYFDMSVEAAAINRLGDVLVRLGNRTISRGAWSPWPEE